MNDKWKILTDPSEVINPGIYQEKLVVVFGDADDRARMEKWVRSAYPETEFAGVPSAVATAHPHSFALWVNKYNPKCSPGDIRAGNIRMKIR